GERRVAGGRRRGRREGWREARGPVPSCTSAGSTSATSSTSGLRDRSPGSTPSARTTGRSWRSATPTTTAGWCRNAAAPDPGPLGDGGFADRAAGAGACDGDRLAGEHREEVAFTRLQVPVLAA